MNKQSKAQVFILLGQSNAVGHDLPMAEEDKIVIPMKNVFGLTREKNQSYDINELTWSGYTSAEMNLGETQDDTYSLANCLATLWQKQIEQGEKLPNLYIVQIAIGGEGVTEKYMWYPKKSQMLQPGKLFEANISLYSFSRHILSLLKKSFEKQNQDYEILGLHWRGGEEEINVPMEALENSLKGIYEELFEGLWGSLKDRPATILHKIVLEERANNDTTHNIQARMDYINQVFAWLEERHGNVTIFDPCKSPFYTLDAQGRGLFKQDLTHFTRENNEWIARTIIEEYKKNNQ